MAKEPFLINPPKRKPRRNPHKKSNTGLKRHRILAFETKDGKLVTSSAAKIVRPGIKINPFRKNPLGEELMFVGLNPFKKGGQKMAKKRSRKRSYKKNPAKRRRYHRNPMSSVKALVPMVAFGGLGALAGRVGPQFIPFLKNMGTLGNLISKGVIAFVGSKLLDMAEKSTKATWISGSSDGWMVGSLASATADLSSLGIVRTMQGLGMIDDETIAPYGEVEEAAEMSGIVDPNMSGIVDPYMSGTDDPY